MAKTKTRQKKSAGAKAKRLPLRSRAKLAAPKVDFAHIPWNSVELEDLNPLLQRQLLYGQKLMIARVLLKKGCGVPEHSHYNEQLTYILEGALKFWIGGEVLIVRAGEVLCIPAHTPHKAEALEDTIDLDIFTPPRADWINKTDQYLRGKT
jgi:quercetin dioxygenase-like cupin family protein